LLDDLRALVEFAQAGSIAGAAGRLYRTPSAITRQLQRLEAELGSELLDRSVKPPRLNSLGSRVLEQARALLQRTEALKSLASRDAEPHGLLRIGLAHPLAEGTFIEPIRALTEKYPKVRVRLLSERKSTTSRSPVALECPPHSRCWTTQSEPHRKWTQPMQAIQRCSAAPPTRQRLQWRAAWADCQP
jgi:DNA-binding transcriptional LysR family regulator